MDGYFIALLIVITTSQQPAKYLKLCQKKFLQWKPLEIFVCKDLVFSWGLVNLPINNVSFSPSNREAMCKEVRVNSSKASGTAWSSSRPPSSSVPPQKGMNLVHEPVSHQGGLICEPKCASLELVLTFLTDHTSQTYVIWIDNFQFERIKCRSLKL